MVPSNIPQHGDTMARWGEKKWGGGERQYPATQHRITKVLFCPKKASRKQPRNLSLWCLLLPDGAAGCTRSGVAAGRRVREKQPFDSSSLMTAATPDEDWRTSVMAIFEVWRSACLKLQEESPLLSVCDVKKLQLWQQRKKFKYGQGTGVRLVFNDHATNHADLRGFESRQPLWQVARHVAPRHDGLSSGRLWMSCAFESVGKKDHSARG